MTFTVKTGTNLSTVITLAMVDERLHVSIKWNLLYGYGLIVDVLLFPFLLLPILRSSLVYRFLQMEEISLDNAMWNLDMVFRNLAIVDHISAKHKIRMLCSPKKIPILLVIVQISTGCAIESMVYKTRLVKCIRFNGRCVIKSVLQL